MNKYNFYLQRHLKDGSLEAVVDIEEHFSGVRYSKLSGIDKYGKPKNIYTEKYAETSEIRVFMPDEITRDNPTIELELHFFGDNRRLMYHAFVDFISRNKLTYWDTCRNRKINIILLDAVEPSDDKLYGSNPYITASFKFTNLGGESTQV